MLATAATKRRSICRWPQTSSAFRTSPCEGLPCNRIARDFCPYISSCKRLRLRTNSAAAILGTALGGRAQIALNVYGPDRAVFKPFLSRLELFLQPAKRCNPHRETGVLLVF